MTTTTGDDMTTTPIDSATEAWIRQHNIDADAYPGTPGEFVRYLMGIALSAALTDPDDALVRAMYEAWPYHDGPMDAPPDDWDTDLTDADREPFRGMFEALVRAILGGAE